MKIIKKINNNVALGQDGDGREVILFGKGIGFERMPYELSDLSRIDRTYYDMDPRYYGLLTEIPEEIFHLVTKFLDTVRSRIRRPMNPNLLFVLADHIHFAAEREQKGMNLSLPYSYELEYEYPEITDLAMRFVGHINRELHVRLGRGEVTSITSHILNAMEGEKKPAKKTLAMLEKAQERTDRVIEAVTDIVETYFGMKIHKDGFHYFRFKNHIKFFVRRKARQEEFGDGNEELYQNMKKTSPRLWECVSQIDAYMEKEFGENCPHEELLYLMIHVNQLCRQQKG